MNEIGLQEQALVERARSRAVKMNTEGWLSQRRWRKASQSALLVDGEETRILIFIATDPSHLHVDEAGELLAEIWARRQDPGVRTAVVQTNAIARSGWNRLLSAALVDRISEAEAEVSVEAFSRLLIAQDEAVKDHAKRFLQSASEKIIRQLWSGSEGQTPVVEFPSDQPLFLQLTLCEVAPQKRHIDALWDRYLLNSPPEPGLKVALRRWKEPGGTAPMTVLASTLLIRPKSQWPSAGEVVPSTVFEVASVSEDEVAKALARWLATCHGSQLIEAICDQAVSDAGALNLCQEHGLAPQDLVRRAKFYLFTNQPEQYRHVDVDGTLLSLIYDGADAEERQLLQQAMLAMRDVNLVRAVVGTDRRARALALSAAELDFLAGQLTERSAWEDLWKLALELPLVTSQELIRRIPRTDWRPQDALDGELYDAFHQTSVTLVQSGRHALHSSLPPAVRVARIHFHGRVNDVSFAPDRPALAVGGSAMVAGSVDLVKGKLDHVYRDFGSSVGRVLHLADGVIIAGERTSSPFKKSSVWECSEGSVWRVLESEASITTLAAYGDSGYFVGSRSTAIWHVDRASRQTTKQSILALRRAGLDWPRSIAISPDTETIAVIGAGVFLADPALTRIKAKTLKGGFAERAILTTGGALVTSQFGTRAAWLSQEGEELRVRHEVQIPGVIGMGYLPDRGQIVFLDERGQLHFASELNGQIAAVVPSTISQYSMKSTSITMSPSGEYAAVGYAPREYSQSSSAEGFVDVFDMRVGDVGAIVDRPLASAIPAHLGILGSLDGATLPANVRILLDLLRSSLEHRFRFDIAITDVGGLTGGEYDIYLERN